jgi:hypothetical protein
MTRTKKTNFTFPLSWYGHSSRINIIDIPQKTLWEYHDRAIETSYKIGTLKKGDRYSIKNNKHSFTVTRYRK